MFSESFSPPNYEYIQYWPVCLLNFFLSSNSADKSKQVLERHATHTAYNNTRAQVNYSMKHRAGMGNDQQCKHQPRREHAIYHSVLRENAKFGSNVRKYPYDAQNTLKCLGSPKRARAIGVMSRRNNFLLARWCIINASLWFYPVMQVSVSG